MTHHRKFACGHTFINGPASEINEFTVIELTIALGIVGLLGTIAVQNLRKVTSRARQTEARLALASVYVAQNSFFLENASYTGCLNHAGITPLRAKRYYAIGLQTDPGTYFSCGWTGAATCASYAWGIDGAAVSTCTAGNGSTYFLATAKYGNPNADVDPTLSHKSLHENDRVSSVTFEITASGSIGGTQELDIWKINQDKSLVNFRNQL